MLKRNPNDLYDLLNGGKSQGNLIEGVILDYGQLKHKLKNPEKKSHYFIKGLLTYKERLKRLRKRFEDMREEFNKATIDDLIATRNEQYEKKQKILANGHINMIEQIFLASVCSAYDYYQELIELKSRINQLHELDYYFEHTDELSKLLGW